MRHTVLVLVLAGCASAAHPRPPTTPDALLAASAGDFHAHAPPHVAAVRNVRFGRITLDDGSTHALLCGELRATERPGAWVGFATLATSGYEQYLGAVAVTWCSDTRAAWQPGDLSLQLDSRLR